MRGAQAVIHKKNGYTATRETGMAVGALDQEQESDGTGGQARGRGGLGQMIRTHSLKREQWAKNRPPKGTGGPRLGSLDKGWCCQTQ
jgi:hypothetical protein